MSAILSRDETTSRQEAGWAKQAVTGRSVGALQEKDRQNNKKASWKVRKRHRRVLRGKHSGMEEVDGHKCMEGNFVTYSEVGGGGAGGSKAAEGWR